MMESNKTIIHFLRVQDRFLCMAGTYCYKGTSKTQITLIKSAPRIVLIESNEHNNINFPFGFYTLSPLTQ